MYRKAFLSHAGIISPMRCLLLLSRAIVSFLYACAQALDSPVFPLFLGRRSCPPACRVLLGILEDETLLGALKNILGKRLGGTRQVGNNAIKNSWIWRCFYDGCSSTVGEGYDVVQRDVPVSFSQEHRRYSFRTVSHATVSVRNPEYVGQFTDHDPGWLWEKRRDRCISHSFLLT